MAFENLFIRTKKSIGGIQLDAVISEGHKSSVRKTQNPVEVGADITDHAIIEPKSIYITAQVSDNPLGVAAFGQIVDNITGLFGTSTTNNTTRSKAAFEALQQLQELREPIEIQTNLKLYRNMLITNIDVLQDKDTSRAVRLGISAEEIILSESEVVILTPEQLEAGSVTQQASTAQKRGRQAAKQPSDSSNKTLSKTVLDWVRGD